MYNQTIKTPANLTPGELAEIQALQARIYGRQQFDEEDLEQEYENIWEDEEWN